MAAVVEALRSHPTDEMLQERGSTALKVLAGVPDGPLSGNGDVGVVVGGEPGSATGEPSGKPAANDSSAMGLYFGKTDFWGFPGAVTYHASFEHFSVGYLLLGLGYLCG